MGPSSRWVRDRSVVRWLVRGAVAWDQEPRPPTRILSIFAVVVHLAGEGSTPAPADERCTMHVPPPLHLLIGVCLVGGLLLLSLGHGVPASTISQAEASRPAAASLPSSSGRPSASGTPDPARSVDVDETGDSGAPTPDALALVLLATTLVTVVVAGALWCRLQGPVRTRRARRVPTNYRGRCPGLRRRLMSPARAHTDSADGTRADGRRCVRGAMKARR